MEKSQPTEHKVKKQWPAALVTLGLGLASGIGISHTDCSSKEPLEPELAKALEPGKLKEQLSECQQLVRKCILQTEQGIALALKERASHDQTIKFLESINYKAGDCCLKQDWRKRMGCYYGKVDIPINKHVKKVRPHLQQF